jgi:hypothetical protein
LLLVLLGWVLTIYGYMASIRDFTGTTPADWQAVYYARATLVTGAGLAFSALSLWFSGLAFHAARRRAIAVVLLYFLPLGAIVIAFARNAI